QPSLLLLITTPSPIRSYPFSEPFEDRRHHAPRKVTRDAIHRWPLFVEKRLRVAGDLVLAAENVVLIIEEHFVLRLIAHGQANGNDHLKDPRPPEIIQQHGPPAKALDRAQHDRVRPFRRRNDFQRTRPTDRFVNYCISETLLDLEA